MKEENHRAKSVTGKRTWPMENLVLDRGSGTVSGQVWEGSSFLGPTKVGSLVGSMVFVLPFQTKQKGVPSLKKPTGPLGCGSRMGQPQNGSVVNGHMDQNLRSPDNLIWTHTHLDGGDAGVTGDFPINVDQ